MRLLPAFVVKPRIGSSMAVISFSSLVLAFFCLYPVQGFIENPANLVNPFIGTANGGNVFPGTYKLSAASKLRVHGICFLYLRFKVLLYPMAWQK